MLLSLCNFPATLFLVMVTTYQSLINMEFKKSNLPGSFRPLEIRKIVKKSLHYSYGISLTLLCDLLGPKKDKRVITTVHRSARGKGGQGGDPSPTDHVL